MSLSSSYLDSASLSSLKSGLERALSALGRLRVTVDCQTLVHGPTSSNMTGEKDILSPTPGLGVDVMMYSYIEAADEYGLATRLR